MLRAALDEVHWHEIADHLLADLDQQEDDPQTHAEPCPTDDNAPWGPIIYRYTRRQAIEDGVLVDVTPLAREAGIRYPTAMTATVWAACVDVPPAVPWQDEKGRLWDLLSVLRFAIKAAKPADTIAFKVHVQNDRHPARPVSLKACCGPGDDGEPVITIMLPDED